MKKVIYSALMMGALAFSTTSCTKTCDAGYEGTDCKTETRAKFLGAFSGTEQCTVGNDQYTVTVTNSSTDVVKVVLSNVYNQAFTATATVDGSTLTITSQPVGTSGSVSGSGTLSGDAKTLTLNYSISNGTTSNACVFTGTKQ